MVDYAVRAEDLRKRFGEVQALDGLDLLVRRGTVCALLGPNGAGKTTAVRALTTLVRLDDGRAEVAGADVRRAPAEVRRRIGLVGQHAAVDELLGARQNLELFGRLQHLPAARARRRAGELLERFGLGDAAERPVGGFSGGMRRRLDLAAGLVAEPQVLFLDEPTTGLDPRARNDIWRLVGELVAGGVSVVLTTQDLDEADVLADDVAVLDRGRRIASGSPDELKSAVGRDRIEVAVRQTGGLAAAVAAVASVTGQEPVVAREGLRVAAPSADAGEHLAAVVRRLGEEDVALADAAVRRPTLDEAFLRLTDRAAA